MKIHITNPLLIKVNPVAKTREDPKYRPRVIPDKTKYNRKKGNKYGKSNSLNDIERSS